ncbi:acetyl CoA synthetase [Gonapodya prolifera JEL478]|uniref:Acetyl-coenzyme A synthetase n=1 Tax=Gonapodya prolifera (strain JEL478) TaxID=1344416 RepID=A0A139AM77_GONPJ|nr:acetyl CoA synthetase [Gonapodya prolifera JEL478]|eukprot:KXS17871.1 acetyl CoA synthetase [Gonapodya prolifera JEL478]
MSDASELLSATGTTPEQVYTPQEQPGWPKGNVGTLDEYRKRYKQSIEDGDVFWDKAAKSTLKWTIPFTTIRSGGFEDGDVSWFHDGYLNACENAVDRWALKNPKKTAIIWESDEPGQHLHISFSELFKQVCLVANVLLSFGVRKGDVVAVYMPMVPEALYAMLACARIGAVHSVVFAGFSADALRDRINDAQCKVVITADQGVRGGKRSQLKKITDEAVAECPCVERVLVFQRTGDVLATPFHAGRDRWWHEEIAKQRPYCPPTLVNSEDPLFILYTSGSTGKPKGVLHTTAGYLLGAALTVRDVFDVHSDDVFGCMADVGWITGHTYICYGPLLNGATTVVFESMPTYPNPGRYWLTVDTHKITQFYTAPTAIRALRRLGDAHVAPYKLDSLRVIGSVGEPINPEAWIWYHEQIGKSKIPIVDTYWQTETGSIIVSPLPRVTPTKPGSATLPFWGIEPAILDPTTGQELKGNDVTGVLCLKRPWPSMARTVFGDHSRYLDVYMKPYKGYYFTGDGVTRDKDGYYWVRGRVDDVINVSGHRLSTAEIESALILHPRVAEAAVIGVNDDVTGQAIFCYVVLKETPAEAVSTLSTSVARMPHPDGPDGLKRMTQELVQQVRQHIGPFATPKRIVISPDLPKTRSGKIMRRILRKVANGEIKSTQEEEISKLGDLSTLADPGIVAVLIAKVHS